MTVNWYDLSKLPAPRPTKPRCVVTLAAGEEGRELHALTGPFLAAYAAKVGADYAVIAPPEAGPYPLAWKWAVAAYIRVYQRVFYVDADALVRPSCPDVFALVPESHVGMVDEADDFMARSPDLGAWWGIQVKALQKALGAADAMHPHAFNAGVYVASRHHAKAFDPPKKPIPLTFCGEQHLLNERLYKGGVPVFGMPGVFNARWMWHRDKVFEPHNHVVHLSGMKPHEARIWALEEEAQNWNTTAPAGVPEREKVAWPA